VCDRLVTLGVYSEVREEAFTCGLLHDLGKPILWIHEAAAYQRILKKIQEEGLDTHNAERAILGFDHAEVAGEVASWWKLPDCIEKAIRDHHLPASETASVRLVQIADWVANREGYSDGLKPDDRAPTRPKEGLPQVPSATLGELTKALKKKHQDIQQVVELVQCAVR